MIFKVAIPGKIQFRMIRREAGLLMRKQGDIHYIGGAEVLPPPLEAMEEEEVINDLGTEDEQEAKATLIEHNLRLVVYIAKKFDNTGVGVEDLISIGTIGLIKSINTFNPLNVDWDGNELLLSDILGTDEDVIYRDIENEVERGLLFKAVNRLSERERTIINLRFGLNTPDGEEMTQKEVAALLGISQSYISRLEKKIIKRLKREMVKEA